MPAVLQATSRGPGRRGRSPVLPAWFHFTGGRRHAVAANGPAAARKVPACALTGPGAQGHTSGDRGWRGAGLLPAVHAAVKDAQGR